MPRMTRTESQTRNRELVLAAARELFLRDGYLATSLAAIADAAGFSTGVVYSNFNGKAELALLVVREIQTEQLAALRGIVERRRPVDETLAAVRKWGESAADSGWPRLEIELALDARSDPDFVSVEAKRQRSAVAQGAEMLRGVVPKVVADTLPLEAIADAAVNYAIGFAIRRLIDPKASLDHMETLLRGAFTS
ncbi:TetR/AcrR family transcriptional regulator [Fodinicola acaciae]|uniref:TetR/AcrR family transcriptional regulator n=1 Tax=Fodinicola acaciae TaxID=2681555 RepID=UPI0013D73589|nr:TetR/AcrR family transcriptional regulator [Fodinicola acaciae]